MFLRLRQLCLVAHDLEPVVQDLMAVFDIEVCHRDPAVAKVWSSQRPPSDR